MSRCALRVDPNEVTLNFSLKGLAPKVNQVRLQDLPPAAVDAGAHMQRNES